MYDPKTQKFTFIDTCFGTHHLQFGFDKNDTLWTSGGGNRAGWLDTKVFDETGSVEKARGLGAVRARHHRHRQDHCRVHQARPAHGSGQGRHARRLRHVRSDAQSRRRIDLVHGQCVRRSERHRALRSKDQAVGVLQDSGAGIRPARRRHRLQGRGLGVAGERSSRQLRSVKCKGPLNGPNATGDQCPEGWTFYKYPGPGFAGIGDNSAEASYYCWVDQHNAVGLGKDVPISTATKMTALPLWSTARW